MASERSKRRDLLACKSISKKLLTKNNNLIMKNYTRKVRFDQVLGLRRNRELNLILHDYTFRNARIISSETTK